MHGLYGDNVPPCVFCGKSLDWNTCNIDHIDEDRSNNQESNLRPTCITCNTKRGARKTNYNSSIYIEANGEKKSLSEWVEDERVNTSRQNIMRRIRCGWSNEEALFKPSQKKYIKNKVDKWVDKYGID